MKFNMVKATELLADDLELLLREINDFCGSVGSRRDELPKILDDYLLYVAKTGNTVFPWQHVRPLFRSKLESAIAAFMGEPLSMENTVYERFDLFRSAPFTIQRFSELITDPKKHYKLKEKYLFALEKAVYVVSTVEPTSPDEEGEMNGDAENETGAGDNEVSYQELNSTFNITPSDTNMTMECDTAPPFPTEFPVISEIPSPILGISAIQEHELDVNPTGETDTVASVPTETVKSETEVKEEKKAVDESVEDKSYLEPVQESVETQGEIKPEPEAEEPGGTTSLAVAEVELENDVFEEIGKVEVDVQNPSKIGHPEQAEAEDVTEKGNPNNMVMPTPSKSVAPDDTKEGIPVEVDDKTEVLTVAVPEPEELKVTDGAEDGMELETTQPVVSEINP